MSARRPALKEPKTNIFIVDDHPIVRQGLAQLISQEPDLTVCGEAEDAEAALEAIGRLRPQLAIVDISLRQGNGIELVKDLKARQAAVSVIVLSMHDEALYAERVLRAGAKGYLMKQEATGKVVAAIRKVLNGGIYLSPEMEARMLKKFLGETPCREGSPVERLSDRELEVLQAIGQGRGTREIAASLHLSVKTIEAYREHLKAKLQLKNARELVRYAIQWVQGEGGVNPPSPKLGQFEGE